MARILIVEDEPDIALGLQRDLALEGYDVEVVGDGDAALARARSGLFDLMLLDVMLPGKDGFTVCRELRRSGRRMPIILLTAKADEAEKVLGLELGADDYVTKPFSPMELRARINRLYRQTIEQARIEHELKIAAEIQRALLPPGRHSGAYYQAMGTSLPSRSIGGDFFDFIDRVDGSFGFALGDVSGKGPAAALLTAKIQGLFSAQSGEGSPADVMRTVNRGLTRRAVEAKYATVFHATLDQKGLLTYCNAGHNPPLLHGLGGVRRLESGSMPVGFFEHVTYADQNEQLQSGDVLVVYSDGVTEALDVQGQEFGEERLVVILEKRHNDEADAILDAIIDAVLTFSTGVPQHDDVTAMAVKYTG
jgi:serine phosphatase RsbU (regulator of sigma subunit)